MKRSPIDVKFVLTHPAAQLPKQNHSHSEEAGLTGDTGYDLFAVEDIIIPKSTFWLNWIPTTTNLGIVELPVDLETMGMKGASYERVSRVGNAVVPVGLTVAYIQPGYWFRIEARSGLGFKKGIQPHPGIIDNMYRGDLAVKLYNFTEVDHLVKAGDRIAQIVFYNIIEAKFEVIESVVESERGEKGFGSSGN